ncbi:MAG: hypothetical protein ACRDNF_00845 [Streptosporangiaceae bacterium]
MQTIEGSELAAKYLSCLEPGETPTFATWLEFASVNGAADWKRPLLLLTSQRLIISKEKLFGKPKADFTITWPEVSSVSGGPWHGTYNPLIQLDVQTRRGALALPVKNVHAVDVESAIRAGYLSNPNHPAHYQS